MAGMALTASILATPVGPARRAAQFPPSQARIRTITIPPRPTAARAATVGMASRLVEAAAPADTAGAPARRPTRRSLWAVPPRLLKASAEAAETQARRAMRPGMGLSAGPAAQPQPPPRRRRPILRGVTSTRKPPLAAGRAAPPTASGAKAAPGARQTS